MPTTGDTNLQGFTNDMNDNGIDHAMTYANRSSNDMVYNMVADRQRKSDLRSQVNSYRDGYNSEIMRQGDEKHYFYKEPMGPIGYDEDGDVIYSNGMPEQVALLKGDKITPVNARITSRFDPYRMHPVLNIVRPHTGVDFGVPSGTSVKMAYKGTVIEATNVGDQRGYHIIVDHGDAFTTRYYHLTDDTLKVDVGKEYPAGTIIAESGNTGIGTGPHLHFETRYNGQAFNPEYFFYTWDLRSQKNNYNLLANP